jgi:hypothetical protein
MTTITNSVGRNAVNALEDVTKIQGLLDKNLHLLIPFDSLGAINPSNSQQLDLLISRIETFQRRVQPLAVADGRVDPNGATLRKLDDNAAVAKSKGLSGKAKLPLYPFPRFSAHDPNTGARFFGANRPGGRKHAGIDLKFQPDTPIRAMADGKVLIPSTPFYDGTNALVIDHKIFIARYGEISRAAPGLNSAGAPVTRGQVIAFVGKLSSGNSMLHLELYSGSENGPLSVPHPPFKRRADLLNPMDFIKASTLNDDSGQDDRNARVGNQVVSTLKVRATQHLNAPVVATLSPGSFLDVLSEVPGDTYPTDTGTSTQWFEVDVDGTRGFAAAFYIDRVSTQAPRPPGILPSIVTLDAVGSNGRVSNRVHSPLNLRLNADLTAPTTAKLDPNILLEIKEKLVGGPYSADGNSRTDWLHVEIKEGAHVGKTGFVAAFYVDPVQRTGRTSAAVTSGLTMRSQPAPDAVRVAVLNPGTRFTVVRGTTGSTYQDAAGSNRSDWLDIEYDSKRGFVAAAFVDLLAPTEVADDPNAILFTYEPKGASDKTARQDNLPAQGIVGVKASEAMAQTDRARVVPHKAKFVEAGKLFNLPPALLAGIASRETRCGNVLDDDGLGDHRNAFGIMQVDKRYHSPIETDGGKAGEAHIQQATEILSDKLDGVNRHFEGLSDSQSLQAAVSRYNGGSGRLPPRSDEGTTGGDYMNDVWARARYYAKVEKW